MKILVWNMDYWKSSKRSEAWEYIRGVEPDIAILNECAPSDSDFNGIHHIQKSEWGVGVFSKQHLLTEHKIHLSHPAAVVITDTKISSKEIRAISLYGQIIDGLAITGLHRSLSDLTPLLLKRNDVDKVLIGGDFNASTQCDETMPSFKGDRSHFLFFERLKNFGLHDCLGKFHDGHIRTLRHKKSDYPYQNDYLFAGKALFDACTSCDVIDDKRLYELSDHNPIIGTFTF